MDVGQDASLGDGGGPEELVQLLVVADSQLDVAGDDAALLVVASGVTGQFEDFSSKVLKDSSQVDRGTSTNALSIVALAQKTVDTANGEGQAGLRGTTKSCVNRRPEWLF